MADAVVKNDGDVRETERDVERVWSSLVGPRILEGDAARLPRLLAANGVERIAAVVSSLPLLSLPAEVVNGIVHGVFEALPRGAALVQFTYGPSTPVPRGLRERLRLQAVSGPRIWRNVPPAVVWTFTRPSAA